jgi:hypothetical protein
MDKVLTRKLFRNKYIELNKPKLPIKKYQEGGIAALSPREKALYAATFAAPLLQAKQAKGQSRLSSLLEAFGAGLEKLPATALAIEKSKPKGTGTIIRQATDFEKVNILGRNPKERIVVKVTDGNIEGIVDKPTAAETEKTAKREGALEGAARIYAQLGPDPSAYPTGPVRGRVGKVAAFFGVAPNIARLNTELESFRKDAIQAMRGAQVGPLEEASFSAILPALTDAPTVVKAKMDTAIAKLKALDDRLNPDGTVGKAYTAEDIVREYGQDLSKFNISMDEISYDPALKTFDIQGGVLTEVGQ